MSKSPHYQALAIFLRVPCAATLPATAATNAHLASAIVAAPCEERTAGTYKAWRG